MTPEQKQQAKDIILKHYAPIKGVVQNNPGMLLDANIMQAFTGGGFTFEF